MLAVFLLVGCLVFDETLAYVEFEEYEYSDRFSYHLKEECESTPSPDTELMRVRRHPDTITTLDPDELDDIKDALKQIMLTKTIHSDKASTNSETNTDEHFFTRGGYDFSTTIPRNDYDNLTPRTRNEYENLTTRTRNDYDNMTPNIIGFNNSTMTMRGHDSLPTSSEDITQNMYHNVVPGRTTLNTQPIDEINNRLEKKELFAYINSMMGEKYRETTKSNISPLSMLPNVTARRQYAWDFTGYIQPNGWQETKPTPPTKSTLSTTPLTMPTTKRTKTQTRSTKRTTTRRTPAKPVQFDIEKFLEIISNLTYDYYTNLTEQVNEKFVNMKVPTCGTPTTTTEPSTTPEAGIIDYSGMGGTVVGKCFVCGLEDAGIPYNAHCADAFAGDFIPLVPQDPSAKGKIARFRKYCRYKNVNNFLYNSTMPRSIFGRWTGGCSVRWTDISGVYTQRSCRNRRQATVGRHFASKRMAKLEMTLSHMDDGCIISPVATLLPLSRGISLFARFHACVCTGNWCNKSSRLDSGVSMALPMTAVMCHLYASLD